MPPARGSFLLHRKPGLTRFSVCSPPQGQLGPDLHRANSVASAARPQVEATMRGLEHTAYTAMVRVVGSGWRPTRFTEAVPPHRACSLCRIVLESSVLLPCFHVLCESCHAGSLVREDGGSCVLDGSTFNLQDCIKTQLPASVSETFAAHCWNEVQGCGFVGKLSDMLRHYEGECAFHAVLCPRCRAWVLRTEMPKHYRDGCPHQMVPTRTSEPQYMPSIVEVTSALREFMALLSVQDQLLPSLQSKLNILSEQAKNHSVRLDQVASGVRETELRLKNDLIRTAEQLATRITADAKVHQRDFIQQATVNDAEAIVLGDGDSRTSSWQTEKRHILHKLELAADDSMNCLHDIRHGVACLLHGHRPGDKEAAAGVHYLTSWAGGKDCAMYRLCVIGAESILTSSAVYPGLAGWARVWHSRGLYFMVVLGTSRWEDKLDLYFRWCSTTQFSAPAPKQYVVTLVHRDHRQDRAMERDYREGAFPAGCRHRFWTRLSDLRRAGFVRDDMLTFHVAVPSDHGSPRYGNATAR